MIEIDAPFLELGFYLADTAPRDAFVKVLSAVLMEGARFSGHVAFTGERDPIFDWVTEVETQEITVKNEEVLPLCMKADRFVVEVGVYGASGLSADRLESVTFVGVPEHCAAIDRHPIEIVAEGYDLDQPNKRAAHNSGRKVVDRFARLVEHIRPDYAAITGETPLDCLSAVRADPRTIAFRDCYISKKFVGEVVWQRILESTAHAFTQPLADGVYISAWEMLNPKRHSLSSTDCQIMSERIATELGSLWKQRTWGDAR